MIQARILIVEDELLVARNIASKLEQAGHEIVGIAATGDEAVQVAAQAAPDLIVMDIRLEGDLDGIEAAGQIQAQMDMPVLYLTAYADETILSRARITTPFGYILKPFQDRELLGNIEIALYKHKMEQKLRANQKALEWEVSVNAVLAELASLLIDAEPSLPDIAAVTMEYARQLTGSEHGFVSSIDPLTGDNVGHTLTLMMGDQCRVQGPDERIVFPVGPDGLYSGLWGHALNTGQGFYTDAPAEHPAAKGILQGHILLQNFMAVPAMIGGRPVGEIALANTPAGYTDRELHAVQRMADLYAVALARKRAEETLVQERLLLRTVIDNLPDAIYAKDLEARKTLSNRADVENIGVESEDDVLGKTDFDLFPREVAERFYADDRQVLQTGQPVIDREERLVNEQGRQIWQMTSKLPIKDRAGQILGLVGIGHDITEQREVEEALKQSEERYRTLFNTMREAFALHEIILDEQGHPCDYRFLELNPAFESLTGLKGTELVGKTVLEVLPGTEPYWIENYGQVALTGEPIFFENYAADLGKYYQVTAFSPKKGQFAVIFVDVTERQEAENALRASETRYRELFDRINSGVAVYRAVDGGDDFAFVDFNRGGERIEQVRREEVIGRRVTEVFPGVIALGLLDVLRQVWQSGEAMSHPAGLYQDDHMVGWRENDVYKLPSGEIVAVYEDVTERKQSEIALRESEQRFRLLFERLPVGYQSLDENGCILEVNPAWLEWFGYERHEVIGRWLGDLMTPPMAQAFAQRFSQFKREGHTHGVEFEMVRRDGSRFLASFEGRVGYDERGNFERTHCILTDITERRQAENALQYERDRAQKYLDIAGVMIVAIDDQGIVTLINQRGSEILGYEQKEIVGQSWFDRFLPERTRQQIRGVFDSLIAGEVEAVEYFENAVLTQGGEEKTIAWHNTILRDDQGRIVGTLSSGEDITERERAVESLRRNNEFMQSFLQNTPSSIFVRDLEGRYLVVNRQYQRVIGRTAEETIGRHPKELHRPQAAEQIARHDDRVLQSGLPFESEEIIFVGDEPHTFAFTQVPLRDADGRPYAICTVATDITERVHAEIERERLFAQMQQLIAAVPEGVVLIDNAGRVLMANPVAQRDLTVLALIGIGDVLEELGGYPLETVLGWTEENAWHEVKAGGRTFEITAQPVPGSTEWVLVVRDMSREREMQQHIRQQDRLAVVGQLAGGVAHDFNNILTAIKGYAGFVYEDLLESDPIRDDIQEIQKAANRATALTRQLLVFSRRQVVHSQVLNLNAVVDNMDKMLRRLIGEHITLETDLDPALGQVEADPGQIEQIIMNLAINARDAMLEGGSIVLATRNVDLDVAYKRRFPDLDPGRYVMLSVQDTGTGISEQARAHLFEPFFTTKEPGKGTGLGLATVYSIVDQSGGYIECKSQVDQGTTFEVYLPLIDAPVPVIQRQDGSDESLRGTETILLVEDDDVVRELARRALERHGYTVLASRLPRQALHLIQNYIGSVSLLVTDVVMPEMNGPELAHKIAQLRPTLQVLYISGYTDDILSNHEAAGPDVTLLHKPFDPNELVKAVRDVLDAN
ncbi:MAG: PAS domain S-box protein [Anaerolineae bacterium]|nr:PAS domain S-box protein [Anaerolineae bacterium]